MTIKANNLPDHEVRKALWYQLVHRLPRGLLSWVGVAGAFWSLGGGDFFGKPMEDTARLIVLAFIAALYGLDNYKQIKGVR